jgi:hypothetical protein
LAKGHATWGENTFARFAEVGASHARAGARVLANGLPDVDREAAVIVYVELWVLGIDDGDEPEEDWAKFKKKVVTIDGELTGDEEHAELHFVKELEDKSRSRDRQVGVEEQL